jgi:hypothetical protein
MAIFKIPLNPPLYGPVWTGVKGNKRTGEKGNSFKGYF